MPAGSSAYEHFRYYALTLYLSAVMELSYDYPSFTRLPLTFTRLLFPGALRKSTENAKIPRWKLLRRDIFAYCNRVKEAKNFLDTRTFLSKGGERKILTQL